MNYSNAIQKKMGNLTLFALFGMVTLVAPSLSEAKPRDSNPAWLLGQSWGNSCWKGKKPEPGPAWKRVCAENKECAQCCLEKESSCVSKYPSQKEKCEKAALHCGDVVKQSTVGQTRLPVLIPPQTLAPVPIPRVSVPVTAGSFKASSAVQPLVQSEKAGMSVEVPAGGEEVSTCLDFSASAGELCLMLETALSFSDDEAQACEDNVFNDCTLCVGAADPDLDAMGRCLDHIWPDELP